MSIKEKEIFCNHSQEIIIDGRICDENVFSHYDEFIYKRKSSKKLTRTMRNREKFVKLYINDKFTGYFVLDKFNRNLHIEGDIKNIKTNY